MKPTQFLIALAMSCCASVACADEGRWIAPGSGLWSQSSNWEGVVPNALDSVAVFDQSPASGSILVDIPLTLGELKSDLPAKLTLLSDESLTLDASDDQPLIAMNVAGTLSIHMPVSAGAGDRLTIRTVDPQSNVALPGPFSAVPFELNKTGVGSLTLGGPNPDWSGELHVREGAVGIQHARALGSGGPSGTTTVYDNAVLKALAQMAIQDEEIHLSGGTLSNPTTDRLVLKGALQVNGSGTLSGQAGGMTRIDGTLQGSGQLLVDSGTFEFAGDDQFAGTVMVDGATTNIREVMRSAIELRQGNLNIYATATESGPIHVRGGLARFRNTATEYGGPIRLSAGKLQVDSNPASLQSIVTDAASAEVTIRPGAVLSIGSVGGVGELRLDNRGQLAIEHLHHAGTVRFENHGPKSISSTVGMAGEIDLQRGTLQLLGPGQGTITAQPGTTLTFANGADSYTGEIHVADDVTITSGASGLIGGPVTWNDGTLHVTNGRDQQLTVTGSMQGQHLRLTTDHSGQLRFNGPIRLAGDFHAAVDGPNKQLDLTLAQVDVGGAFDLDYAKTRVTGPMTATGDVNLRGSTSLTLEAAGNVLGELTNVESSLIVDGDSQTRVLLVGRGGTVSGTGKLTVSEQVHLRRGSVDFSTGSLVGAPEVIKDQPDLVRISNLGDEFVGNVVVTRGILELTGPNAMGSGTVTLEDPLAVIRLDSDEPVHGRVFLNNAKGWSGMGGLTPRFAVQEFTGEIHLGDIGSNLAGAGTLRVSGTIHGGAVTVRPAGTQNVGLELKSKGHTYTGPTTVSGAEQIDAALSLSEFGELTETAAIVLLRGADLNVYSNAEFSSDNRIGDDVPISVDGGIIDIAGPGETLGALSNSGASQFRLAGDDSTFSVKSLRMDPHATFHFQARGFGGIPIDGDPPAVKMIIEGQESTDFLGGAIILTDQYHSTRFTKYDAAMGLIPLSDDQITTRPSSQWQPHDHVKLERPADLSADREIATLNAATRDAAIVNLRGATLNVGSGGVIANHMEVEGPGRLTAGRDAESADLYFHVLEIANVRANISDNPGPDGVYDDDPMGSANADNGRVHLVKAGRGRLSLSGTNTYTGETRVHDGVLWIDDSSSLPPNSDLIVHGGSLSMPDDLVLSPATFHLTYGSVVGGTLNTPLAILESGGAPAFVGEGVINKISEGRVALRDSPRFSGTIDVREGTLLVDRRSLGTATTVVHPGAVLEPSHGDLHHGLIELRGGTISSGNLMGIGPQSGLVLVTADSTLRTVDPISRGDMYIRSRLHLTANVTLEKIGDSYFELERDLMLEDGASLRLNEGESRILHHGGTITVGARTSIDSQGEAYVRGTIFPTSDAATLDLTGSGWLDVDFSVHARSGTSLSVLRDGNATPLNISGEDGFLTGGGTIDQDVTLFDSARLNPGDSGVGTLSIMGSASLDHDTVLNWQMADADATPLGQGVDLLRVSQTLTFESSQRNAYRFNISGVDEVGRPASVLNFDPTSSRRWLLIDAGIVEGFSPTSVDLNVIGFDADHSLPAGSEFSIVADQGNVHLSYDVLLGDFDGDDALAANDLDRLTRAVRMNTNDLSLDVNYDDRLDTDDRRFWIHDIFGTYFGDANLDGEFSSGDLVGVFTANQYEDAVAMNSIWATGDWDGDGDFTSGDLVLAFSDGGFEQGPRPAAAVPEPNGKILALLSVCIFLVASKSRPNRLPF